MLRPSRAERLYRRAARFSFTRRKISTPAVERLYEQTATPERTLAVQCSGDVRRYFPHLIVVSRDEEANADIYVDNHFVDLHKIPDESFPVIVCTGVLEHVPDPQRLIADLHRILAPGGRLILAASAVMAFHHTPDNFFHFTPYGLRTLFSGWTRFDVLRGSSTPFETVAILLQRIHMQCELTPPVRPLVEVLFHTLPHLDRFVLRQYGRRQPTHPRFEIDNMMPANLHAVIIK